MARIPPIAEVLAELKRFLISRDLKSTYSRERPDLERDVFGGLPRPTSLGPIFGRRVRPDFEIKGVPVELKLIKEHLKEDGTFVASIQALNYALLRGMAIALLITARQLDEVGCLLGDAEEKYVRLLEDVGARIAVWSLAERELIVLESQVPVSAVK